MNLKYEYLQSMIEAAQISLLTYGILFYKEYFLFRYQA